MISYNTYRKGSIKKQLQVLPFLTTSSTVTYIQPENVIWWTNIGGDFIKEQKHQNKVIENFANNKKASRPIKLPVQKHFNKGNFRKTQLRNHARR